MLDGVNSLDSKALGVFARELRPDDLVECLSVNPECIGDQLVGRNLAIEVWGELMRHGSFTAAVMEAPRPVAGCRIVAFGAAVFVSPAFASAEIGDPQPGLNSRIVASIASGKSVVLSADEVRMANTEGGLDLVVLCGCWRSNLPAAALFETASCLAARFMRNYQGYRLNRLMGESFGAQQRAWLEATHIWKTLAIFHLPDGEERSLSVITRQDALSVPATMISPLFVHKEPVFGLRDAEQRLLLAALDGLTDEQLSARLGSSLAAVKKRWISVFERTADANPGLFPDLDESSDGVHRGRQKRHHVLAYMREHPEELRPRAAALAPGAGAQSHR